MFEGKVCPILASGVIANKGNATIPVTRQHPQGGYDPRAVCIQKDCALYPICKAKVEEAEMK